MKALAEGTYPNAIKRAGAKIESGSKLNKPKQRAHSVQQVVNKPLPPVPSHLMSSAKSLAARGAPGQRGGHARGPPRG